MAFVAAAWSIGAFAHAGERTPHVRAIDSALAELIDRGIEQSPTFRQLVQAIDASDTYVYIKEGSCGLGVMACFVAVTPAGQSRFMWVKVNPRRHDHEVIGSIGHELRHTLEVIVEHSIRTNGDTFFFYERSAAHARSGDIETSAAVEAGAKILSEMRAFQRRARR